MRLFTAIELETSMKVELGRIQRNLTSFGRVVRWVKPEQMHLTLVFLGEVDDTRVADITDAVSLAAESVSPFEIALSGSGCFPNRGAVRVVWVGVEESSGGLLQLQDVCADTLDSIGFPRESRPFSPHLTLGRVRDDRTRGELRTAVEAVDVSGIQQEVNSVRVIQSELLPQGPRYTMLAECPLGGKK